MSSKRRSELMISVGAGMLAVVVFVAGAVVDDAILRAIAAGLLVMCIQFAVPWKRRTSSRGSSTPASSREDVLR